LTRPILFRGGRVRLLRNRLLFGPRFFGPGTPTLTRPLSQFLKQTGNPQGFEVFAISLFRDFRDRRGRSNLLTERARTRQVFARGPGRAGLKRVLRGSSNSTVGILLWWTFGSRLSTDLNAAGTSSSGPIFAGSANHRNRASTFPDCRRSIFIFSGENSRQNLAEASRGPSLSGLGLESGARGPHLFVFHPVPQWQRNAPVDRFQTLGLPGLRHVAGRDGPVKRLAGGVG